MDSQNEEMLDISSINEDNDRLTVENNRISAEIETYKKDIKKKEDNLQKLKEEKKTCKEEEERLWKENNDNIDLISNFRVEMSDKDIRILEVEEAITSANNEIEDEKKSQKVSRRRIKKTEKRT